MSFLPLAVLVALSQAPGPDSGRKSFTEHLVDTGRVFLRPIQPQPQDALLVVPAAAATVLVLGVDVPIYHEIHDRWPDPMVGGERFSYWGSFLGEGWVDLALFGVIGAVGWGGKGEKTAIAGLQALVATAVVSRALKLTIRLERPSYDPDAKHVFSRWKADAMPSGHAMSAFSTAAVLARQYPAGAPVFYALATYVGVARVQQSTHWAGDVIVGGALGLLFGWEAARLNGPVELAPMAVENGAGVLVTSKSF